MAVLPLTPWQLMGPKSAKTWFKFRPNSHPKITSEVTSVVEYCKDVFTAAYVKVRLSHKKRKPGKKDNSVSSRIILACVTTSTRWPV